jgi:hypothetical protein
MIFNRPNHGDFCQFREHQTWLSHNHPSLALFGHIIPEIFTIGLPIIHIMNGYPIYYDWLPRYSVFIPYVPYTTPFTNLVSLPCFSTHASNPIPTSGAQNLGDLGLSAGK